MQSSNNMPDSVAAVTTALPKTKANDFFKKWRQRRDKDLKPWADKEMLDASREVLEELGFPVLKNEASVKVSRGPCARAQISYFQSHLV